jgi:hypothetical protein
MRVQPQAQRRETQRPVDELEVQGGHGSRLGRNAAAGR